MRGQTGRSPEMRRNAGTDGTFPGFTAISAEMRGQTGRSPVFTGSHAEITAAGGLGSEKFFDTFSKSGRKTGNVTSAPSSSPGFRNVVSTSREASTN